MRVVFGVKRRGKPEKIPLRECFGAGIDQSQRASRSFSTGGKQIISKRSPDSKTSIKGPSISKSPWMYASPKLNELTSLKMLRTTFGVRKISLKSGAPLGSGGHCSPSQS